MDPSDAELFRKEVADIQSERKQVGAKPTPKRMPMPRKKKACNPLADAVFTSEYLAKYVPPVPLASFPMQIERHTRVRVIYPRDAPPVSHSKVFSDLLKSMKEVALECIRWLWKEHRAATGAHCPFDIFGDGELDL